MGAGAAEIFSGAEAGLGLLESGDEILPARRCSCSGGDFDATA